MSDKMYPTSISDLARWIKTELNSRGSIFGLPQELFYHPRSDSSLELNYQGYRLDTPLGVAAGPHTQMAQNIVTAWLAGARFIELKTVQTLDQLEVTKPCIDMEDVGYNCEWSQELRLNQSFEEYLKAWIIIHWLKDHLGFSDQGPGPGFAFNMSVGYDLKGIHQNNVQQFIQKMTNAKEHKQRLIEEAGLSLSGIGDCLVQSVTLSTMHGCPPEEIERIGKYLIEELGFHTSIKLNPTLLGPELLREILHHDLGFDDIEVPDQAFEHDPDFNQAKDIIISLKDAAKKKGVFF